MTERPKVSRVNVTIVASLATVPKTARSHLSPRVRAKVSRVLAGTVERQATGQINALDQARVEAP